MSNRKDRLEDTWISLCLGALFLLVTMIVIDAYFVDTPTPGDVVQGEVIVWIE